MGKVIDRAECAASGQIAQDAAKLLPAEIDRRLIRHTAAVNRTVLIATPVAAMLVLALGIGGGYIAGYRHGEADAISTVTDLRAALAEGAPGATIWRNLIQWNGAGIEESMKACQPAQPVDGRQGCFVPLWTGPAVFNGGGSAR